LNNLGVEGVIKEYIDRYLDLHSKTCRKPGDYEKISLRKHNKAMRELISLYDEINSDRGLAEEVYSELLQNADMDVQLSAAASCLKLNIHIEDATEILERISKTGHSMAATNAVRVLGVWRGEIDPDKPW